MDTQKEKFYRLFKRAMSNGASAKDACEIAKDVTLQII